MRRSASQHPLHGTPAAPAELPPGTPSWVTQQLLMSTLDVWQPFYAEPLTAEDALEILLSASRVLDALEADDDETVSGLGPGFQP